MPPKIKVRFVGLHAPGFVPTNKFDEIKQYPVVQASFDRVKEIDVFLTSAGGHWNENEAHSMLFNMFEQLHGESLAQLKAADVVGDLMWLPFSRASLDIHTAFRTMTLLELSDLPQMVKDKKKVILAIAPCGYCGVHKGEILRTILEHSQRAPLITHLVADHRSVEAAL